MHCEYTAIPRDAAQENFAVLLLERSSLGISYESSISQEKYRKQKFILHSKGGLNLCCNGTLSTSFLPPNSEDVYSDIGTFMFQT
jgi:hypothetical protein